MGFSDPPLPLPSSSLSTSTLDQDIPVPRDLLENLVSLSPPHPLSPPYNPLSYRICPDTSESSSLFSPPSYSPVSSPIRESTPEPSVFPTSAPTREETPEVHYSPIRSP